MTTRCRTVCLNRISIKGEDMNYKKPERDEEIELEAFDYDVACNIMEDIQGRENWSTPKVLAQWVATLRRHCRLNGQVRG